MSGRTRTVFVAVLAVAVMPADALAGNGGKPKLEAKEKSQKAILDADAIAVSAKNLDEKITVVAEAKSFDSQGFEKIAASTVLKPDDKSGKLALKKSGRRASRACQPQKIKLSAKGAEKATFDLKRNSRLATCRSSTSRGPASATRSHWRKKRRQASPPACCRSPTTTTRSRTPRARPAGGSPSGRARCPRTRPARRSIREPYNLNDGFSPGQAIALKVPGLDTPEALAATEPDPAQRPRPLTIAGARTSRSS